MGVIAIRCPRTSREVSTGVEMSHDEFHGLRPSVFRMRCEACGSEHAWSRATAKFLEAEAPRPQKQRDSRPRDILDDLLNVASDGSRPRAEPITRGDRITALDARLREPNR